MIVGLGTAIVEVQQIRRMAAQGEAWRAGIFTDDEIAYCESKARRLPHYAARYAAKAATLQAVGSAQGISSAFAEVEVTHDERGRPSITVKGTMRRALEQLRAKRTSISLSHDKHIAIAVILLED